MSAPGRSLPNPVPAPRVSAHDPAIANLSSLGILLVVLGHSTPTSLATVSSPSQAVLREILHLISAFHMPLFFFISGYLFMHTLRPTRTTAGDYLRWVRSKARRLLLPYWLISTAAFPFKTLFATEAARPLAFSFKDYATSLLVPWQNTIIFYWFLPTLFLIFLVAPLLALALRSESRLAPWATTTVLILLNLLITPIFWQDPMNYRGAAAHTVTFWIGMLWHHRAPQLTIPGHALLGTAGALGFAILCLVDYARVFASAPLAQAALRLGLAWTGVAMCLGWIQALTLSGRLTRVPGIHGLSYQIYLLSWFPQMFLKIAVFRWLGAGFWPTALLMLAGGLAVPVWIAQGVTRRFPALKPCLGMG